jgi:S-DNA-T family DNA segregation ATPase FtsK/SpoIIIE
VRLWIADSGALDEPIGAVAAGHRPGRGADYKTGRAPGASRLRGDAVALSVYQRMLLITGLSNQGKTASLRALALWLIFDPTVEFWIGDLKGVGDWGMFQGLAPSSSRAPPTNTPAPSPRWSRPRRGDGAPPPSPPGHQGDARPARRHRRRGPGRVHEPAKDDNKLPYGGRRPPAGTSWPAAASTTRAAPSTSPCGRAPRTPPTRTCPSGPRGAHIRASLVVGTESQAKMALGDKAVDGGAAPTSCARASTRAPSSSPPTASTWRPASPPSPSARTSSTTDPAKEIAERAKAAARGVATVHKLEVVQDVDHLADIAAVVGRENRVRTTEVIHRLKTRNHAVYEHWNGAPQGVLAEYGEEPGTLDGYPVVEAGERRAGPRSARRRSSQRLSDPEWAVTFHFQGH